MGWFEGRGEEAGWAHTLDEGDIQARVAVVDVDLAEYIRPAGENTQLSPVSMLVRSTLPYSPESWLLILWRVKNGRLTTKRYVSLLGAVRS